MTVLVFAAHLLLIRSVQRHVYFPLALVQALLGHTASTTSRGEPHSRFGNFLILFFALPAFSAIAPGFWLYVEGITSETRWRIMQVDHRHFLLPIIGLGITLFAFLFPSTVTGRLKSDGDEQIIEQLTPLLRNMAYGALILTFGLVLDWVLQASYYLSWIVRRLSEYHQHLTNIFASIETREANWLAWLLIALAGTWFLSATNIVWDNLFNTTLINDALMHSLYLLLVWSVMLWGLRQKPGFEELYISGPQGSPTKSRQNDEDLPEATSRVKYSRSVLNAARSANIATAIERAMREDKLYLDNAISLQKLARHIHEPPNYVSQTLNETLDTSFFDFINKQTNQYDASLYFPLASKRKVHLLPPCMMVSSRFSVVPARATAT